jgi:hypothetical protein
VRTYAVTDGYSNVIMRKSTMPSPLRRRTKLPRYALAGWTGGGMAIGSGKARCAVWRKTTGAVRWGLVLGERRYGKLGSGWPAWDPKKGWTRGCERALQNRNKRTADRPAQLPHPPPRPPLKLSMLHAPTTILTQSSSSWPTPPPVRRPLSK